MVRTPQKSNTHYSVSKRLSLAPISSQTNSGKSHRTLVSDGAANFHEACNLEFRTLKWKLGRSMSDTSG